MPDVYRLINGRWQGITEKTQFDGIATDLQIVRVVTPRLEEAENRLRKVGINPDCVIADTEFQVPDPEVMRLIQAYEPKDPGTNKVALENAARACGVT